MRLLKSVALLTFSCLAVTLASAADAPFLADRHVAKGIQCSACHSDAKGTLKREGPKQRETCVTCHGWYDVMAKKTTPADPDEQNVHAQHDGELDCTVCHKGHQKGVNYCSKCHMWEFKVP